MFNRRSREFIHPDFRQSPPTADDTPAASRNKPTGPATLVERHPVEAEEPPAFQIVRLNHAFLVASILII